MVRVPKVKRTCPEEKDAKILATVTVKEVLIMARIQACVMGSERMWEIQEMLRGVGYQMNYDNDGYCIGALLSGVREGVWKSLRRMVMPVMNAA